jgi:hypothetical protein
LPFVPQQVIDWLNVYVDGRAVWGAAVRHPLRQFRPAGSNAELAHVSIGVADRSLSGAGRTAG